MANIYVCVRYYRMENGIEKEEEELSIWNATLTFYQLISILSALSSHKIDVCDLIVSMRLLVFLFGIFTFDSRFYYDCSHCENRLTLHTLLFLCREHLI